MYPDYPIGGHRVWLAFHVVLLLLLGVELVFSRSGLAPLAPEARARRQYRNAIFATLMWVGAALAFAAILFQHRGPDTATQFLAGYTIEESLSVDNLFVFLLLFRVFAIPSTFQPRVLFWGVLGAIVLRGTFILAGIRLLDHFRLATDLFAAILFYAAIHLVVPSKPKAPPTGLACDQPLWIRWISRIRPVSPRTDVFFAQENGRSLITMLFLALLAIEVADIIFAFDSIPAVLSITRNSFLAYTSNILAVMSLRSLYFVLARMLHNLRFLHFGLAAILAFAAMRMLLTDFYDIPNTTALLVVVGILALTIAASLLAPKKKPLAAAA